MGGLAAKGASKNRKYGTKIPGAIVYKAENRYARNKRRTLTRHIQIQPNDNQAAIAMGGA